LQDDDRNPPTISRSGQPINYALPADKPNIGHNAPSLTDVATGRKCKLPITKVTSCKKKKSPGQSSAVAILQTDDLTNLPSSSLEGNFLDSLYACIYLDTNHIIHSNHQDIPKDQSEGEEENLQSTPPPSSSIIQVQIFSLSKYLNFPTILILAFSLIPSGTAFTFGSQETLGRFSNDPGMILEFIHKSILRIIDNYLSTCRSYID